MKRFVRLFFILLLPILFNCSREFQPLGPASSDFRYPLNPGAEWAYDRQIKITPNRSATPSDLQKSRVYVRVVGEENRFDAQATKVSETVEANGISTVSYSYYDNRKDGLYLLGYLGAGVALPKVNAKMLSMEIFVQAARRGAASYASGDSIYREIPPKQALKYPLIPGSRWKFRKKGQPRRIDKKVIAETAVETPAGKFNVVQVQWIMDFDGDGAFDDNIEFFDYISNAGLVKRSFLIKNLPLLDDSGANIGSYNYLDESILTSFKQRDSF